MPRHYWLVKSEPDVFSIDDLAKRKSTFWDGVRNYQARNLLRDEMKPGDSVLFYHSNAKPPGVAGVAEVVKAARPDPTQFDKTSAYFDEGATPASPRWYGVDIKFRSKFKQLVSLPAVKSDPALANMILIKRGRLSVQPVTEAEYHTIVRLGGSTP